MRVLVATSNQGKLRDFAGAAAVHDVDVHRLEVAALPGFAALPPVAEDGTTFEENARKKAEHYSRYAPGALVLADDSGLSVDALHGAPGVHSARYALLDATAESQAGPAGVDLATVNRANADQRRVDQANNAKLLRELEEVADRERGASFVCVISAARDGQEVAHFRGEARGMILRQPRGQMGFGYDPLFYMRELGKSFAELAPEQKALVSHRGAALRKFLEWARAHAR